MPHLEMRPVSLEHPLACCWAALTMMRQADVTFAKSCRLNRGSADQLLMSISSRHLPIKRLAVLLLSSLGTFCNRGAAMSWSEKHAP